MITAAEAKKKQAFDFSEELELRVALNIIDRLIRETAFNSDVQFIKLQKVLFKKYPVLDEYLKSLGYVIVDAFDDENFNVSWASLY